MTMQDFARLNDNEKLQILIRQSRLCGEQDLPDARMYMYIYGTFYVTVTYAKGTDELVSIRPFVRMSRRDVTRWKINTSAPIRRARRI
jgi:hypothetical protein